VKQTRIIGLDVGEARIGVAISDPTLKIAQPLLVIERRSVDADAGRICRLAAERGAHTAVVGLPLTLKGERGTQAQAVEAFARKLEESGLEVVMWDERMTTRMAERSLLEADMSRRDRKRLTDKVAAVLILQSYLDYLNEGSTDETPV